MSRKGITKEQFHQALQLWIVGNDIEMIATKVGIKPSTVRLMRQCVTWHEYCRRRAVHTKRAADARRLKRPQNERVQQVADQTAGLAHALQDAYSDYVTNAEAIHEKLDNIIKQFDQLELLLTRQEVPPVTLDSSLRGLQMESKRRWFGRK